jgi:hypothetical protein
VRGFEIGNDLITSIPFLEWAEYWDIGAGVGFTMFDVS